MLGEGSPRTPTRRALAFRASGSRDFFPSSGLCRGSVEIAELPPLCLRARLVKLHSYLQLLGQAWADLAFRVL